MIPIFLMLLLSYLGFILTAYIDIREIIWSIVWLEKKGKHRKLKELKAGVSTWSLITMKYLLPYVGNYKRQFLFWYRFKYWYLGIERILWILSACIIFFTPLTKLYVDACIVIFAQGVIASLFIRFQFDGSWRTKYDRMH